MMVIVSIFSIVMIAKLMYFNNLIGGKIYSIKGLVISSIGALLILLCLMPIIKSKWRMRSLLMLDIVITFIIVSNLLFYRYFNDIITLPIITQIILVGSVSSSVVSLIHISDILFFADFLLLVPAFRLAKYNSQGVKLNRITSIFASIALFTVGLALSYYGVLMLDKNQPNILTTFYDKAYIAQHIGLLNYHAIDAFKFFKEEIEKNNTLSEDERNKIKLWFKEKKDSLEHNPRFFGTGKGKNVIVVQVEALQGFVIGKKINGMDITPNLNKLIERSIYFNNYYCETSVGGTSDAEFLANTSLFPLKTGAVYMKYPGNYYYSLPKVLKEQGYDTYAMHAYKPGFWNRSVMYPSLGFDEYLNRNHYDHDEVIGMGLSDKSFFRQSLDYLKNVKEPYYAFMVTLTSHYPYDNTKAYNNVLNVGELKGTFLGNYLEAIHYADASLGYLIDRLEEEGLMDNTILAIYGDHHAVSKDKKDELANFLDIDDMNDYMWVKLQKVPLIIHLPGDEGAGIRTIAGGGVDLMPTLINIMGIDSNSIPMMGRDLLNSDEGIAVMRNGYFVDDRYLCLTADGAAFDINTGEPYLIENLKDKIDKILIELDISEKIIENDLIEEIVDYLSNVN
ncbi:LTA synthase family protein [Lutispora thermophila]|uniref:Phosphoglycerol transferase MdoB n=1 Tax=Lutispora thermophila DSM 19022 TaxID=1122184 RepID=A0A1M6EW53_9FIRM|nr:LTA synthase family protein [Lutispora thermophila]SHI89662.1 Phosphoglycerol transferase MdoB [Lutispora thermophila DSM 19022]